MIEFERVSRRFGDQDALRNLNLTLESGEMAFLTGHSGAGKSTLLRLLLLLDRPSSGEIRVNGESTSSIRSRKVPRYRRRFGVVFQDVLKHDAETTSIARHFARTNTAGGLAVDANLTATGSIQQEQEAQQGALTRPRVPREKGLSHGALGGG